MSMLTVDEKYAAAIKEIRSAEFNAEFNLASGTSMMKRFVRASRPYKTFLECLDYDLERYTDRISAEMLYLSTLYFDHSYGNPYDEQMTVLAMVMLHAGFQKQDFAEFLCKAALCFWLYKV